MKIFKILHKYKIPVFYLIFGIFIIIIKILSYIFTNKNGKIHQIKRNFKDFCAKEEEEAVSYKHGRISFSKFCHDTSSIFVNYFIPHKGNNHRAKILHMRSLATLVILMIVIKASIVGFLFLSDPYKGLTQESIAKQTLELINTERTQAGFKALIQNLVLNISAREKANDMIAQDYFSHYGPDGKKPWDWIDRSQYKYLYVGENLAMNFTSAESAHRALMNSPSHKKNIMNERYSEVGLAVVSGTMSGKKSNILVQLFATRQSVSTKLAVASEIDQKETESPVEEKNIQEEIPVAGTTNAEQESPPENNVNKNVPIEAPEKKITETKPVNIVTPIADTDKQVEPELEPQAPIEKPVLEPAKLAKGDIDIINAGNTPTQVLSFENTVDDYSVNSVMISRFVTFIFATILVVLSLSLLINIFYRIHIQHKPTIIQTLLVILFTASLIYFRFHILESGIPNILVL